MGARVTGCEIDFRVVVVVGRRTLDVVSGRRAVGGAREVTAVIVRVAGVVRCTAGRVVGLVVTTDFAGGGLTLGFGLASAKGLSSSVKKHSIKTVTSTHGRSPISRCGRVGCAKKSFSDG